MKEGVGDEDVGSSSLTAPSAGGPGHHGVRAGPPHGAHAAGRVLLHRPGQELVLPAQPQR